MDELEKAKEKAAAEERRKKEEAKRQAKIDAARIAINAAGEDANVRIVLRYLAEVCDVRGNPAAVGSDFDIKTNSTMYNVGRMSIFKDIRKLMSAETENVILQREE